MRSSIYPLLLFGLLLAGCGRKKEIIYEGHVFNASNVPLEDMTVTLSGCNVGFGTEMDEGCDKSRAKVGEAVTDASGHFLIKGKPTKQDMYFVHILNNKTGFPTDQLSHEETTAAGLSSEKYTHLIAH